MWKNGDICDLCYVHMTNDDDEVGMCWVSVSTEEFICSSFLISVSVPVSGVHILQRMSGCEWDDETGEVIGFNQYGYDGEDLISIDLKTETWIAPRPQAVITKLKWDADEVKMKYNQNYLKVIFPEWLKNYVAYGRSFLLRTGRIT